MLLRLLPLLHHQRIGHERCSRHSSDRGRDLLDPTAPIWRMKTARSSTYEFANSRDSGGLRIGAFRPVVLVLQLVFLACSGRDNISAI